MNCVLFRFVIVFGLLWSVCAKSEAQSVQTPPEEAEGKAHNLFADKTITETQKRYLRKKRSIGICVDPDWMPFEKIDSSGKYVGIIADYAKLFSKKLHTPFVLQPTSSYKESREFLLKGKCDVIMADVATPLNKRTYLTTKPYFTTPRAYATHIDTPWVQDFAHLVTPNTRIGVMEATPAETLLKKAYNGIRLVSFKNTEEGLKALSTKKIIALVTTMPSLAYSIQQNNMRDVRISGYLKEDVKLSFLVNKREPILADILRKAIDTVTEQERIAIFDKWIKVTIDQTDDSFLRVLVWIVLGMMSIGILILFILRQNNKKLHILINSTIEGILLFRNGKCIDANEQALKLFGYDGLENIKEKDILDFVTERSQKRVESKIRVNESNPYESQMRRKDSSVFPALLKGAFINKKKTLYILTVIDLSRLKNVENALQKLNINLQNEVRKEVAKNREKDKYLMYQSRLAQMGEMISMIAHQWRQPLAAIAASAAVLTHRVQREELDTETVEKIADNIQKYTKHLSETIDDFRGFFKPNKEKESTTWKAIVEDVIRIVEIPLYNKDIKLIKEIRKDTAFTCYANEIKQVLLNLIKNAEDVLSERKVQHGEIHIIVEERKVKVMDNGGGIAEDILEKIFDPYFSTKEEKGGTGLGLYMSKMIIEEHSHGKLSVHNDEKGAVFTIELPEA
jgi:PAS domain S-box-containing protein